MIAWNDVDLRALSSKMRPSLWIAIIFNRLDNHNLTFVTGWTVVSYRVVVHIHYVSARFHFRDPPDYNEGDHPT